LRPVRGPGYGRPPGAGAAPAGGAHRPDRPAALHETGHHHARLARRRAAGAAPLAPVAARRRGAAVVSGRDALRGSRLLTALLLDAGAAAARLPALRRGLGRDGEGGQALRPVGLPGVPLRQALGPVVRAEQWASRPAEPRD